MIEDAGDEPLDRMGPRQEDITHHTLGLPLPVGNLSGLVISPFSLQPGELDQILIDFGN